MKNFKYILTISFFILSASIHGQIDTKTGTEEKGKKKIALPANAKKITKPKVLGNDNKNGFQNAYGKQQQENAKKKKEEDLNNKGILTKAKIAEAKVNAEVKSSTISFLFLSLSFL